MTQTTQIIETKAAPQAIGTYSQAVLSQGFLFLSGQIPLQPDTAVLISPDIEPQIHQTFRNLSAVLTAAGKDFSNLVQLRIYLLSLDHFSLVNEIMATYIQPPYPARAAVGVQALPKGALIEIEGIAH